MEEYYVVTFQNTHEAMNGEKVAKQNNVSIQVIPTPTYITKSCGISLRVKEEDIKKVKELIQDGKMNVKNVYLKKKEEVLLIM